MPELACLDLPTSRAFYVDVLGFAECYQRDGFAYLGLGKAQLMLEQAPGDWAIAPLERPYGRGINIQIEVDAIQPILGRLAAQSYALFMEPRECWYRTGEVEHGQREFIVQDPDGYLLRFCQVLGERKALS